MPSRIGFSKATADEVVLARVGNPLHDEPLETSRKICRIGETDRDLFSQLILKPFRSLARYHFGHHSSLDKNETYTCARAIFTGQESFLEKGCEI
ncbi:MAG: hypothetical protein VYC95_04475, partial [Verrucomicrobiota bacterium]|nr:hypothetical protein [Verrucomicrobiota bacterium]